MMRAGRLKVHYNGLKKNFTSLPHQETDKKYNLKISWFWVVQYVYSGSRYNCVCVCVWGCKSTRVPLLPLLHSTAHTFLWFPPVLLLLVSPDWQGKYKNIYLMYFTLSHYSIDTQTHMHQSLYETLHSGEKRNTFTWHTVVIICDGGLFSREKKN